MNIKKKNLKFARVVIPALLLLAFLVPNAYSQSGSFNVSVEALEEISIIEIRRLDFGRIIAPTDITQTFTISPGGTRSQGGGNGRFLSGQQSGILSVTGSDGEFFNASSSPGACSGFTGGVALTATAVLPTTGILDRPLQVGATVQVDPGASGSGTCAYTVNINYM